MSSSERKIDLIVLTGPTGSGKSKLAVQLAEDLREANVPAEIVNGDSIQLYKYFDLGSAKPEPSLTARVPHHLFSILEPDAPFDVAEFTALARTTVRDLAARQVLPIVVGGSGLYIRSLLCGIVAAPEIDPQASQKLAEGEENLRRNTLSDAEFCAKMHRWLAELDTRSASRIRPSDLVRIRRALRVALSSGESLAALQDLHQHSDRPFRACVLLLCPAREELYRGIEQRVDEMMRSGLIEEVKQLRQRFGEEVRPFKALGYRQLLDVCDEIEQNKKVSSEKVSGEREQVVGRAVDEIKRRTKNYAKRQYTWWRHQPESLGWRDVTGQLIQESSLQTSDKRAVLKSSVRDFLSQTGSFRGDGIFLVRTDDLGRQGA